MEAAKPAKPRIFIDADVLIAGAASPNEQNASNLILRMAELTLIDGITSTQVIAEVERNLTEKIPIWNAPIVPMMMSSTACAL